MAKSVGDENRNNNDSINSEFSSKFLSKKSGTFYTGGEEEFALEFTILIFFRLV